MIVISTSALGLLCGLLGFSLGVNYMFIWQIIIRPPTISFKGDLSDAIHSLEIPSTPFVEKATKQ